MPLPTRVRTRLIDAINVVFKNIGNASGVRLPNFTTDKTKIAWEYWLSKHVEDMAKGRFKEAKAAAVQAGVIFDHERSPRDPGFYPDIYMDDQVIVSLIVKNGSRSIDTKKVYDYLVGKGVKSKLLDEAYEHATKWSKPAHEFKVALAVETPE